MIARLLISLSLASLQIPAQAVDIWREPATGMEFVPVAKGCYKMGLPPGTFQYEGEGMYSRARTEMPEHEVCLDAFWIGRHEVRASDWAKVMGTPRGNREDDTPVTGVRWDEAVEFARKLTALSGGTTRFRLPTEAEWEYACRAGAKATTSVPDRRTLEGSAWFSSSYNPKYSRTRLSDVQPVGQKTANAWGLHDMLGNAWEWVQDAYRADAYGHHKLYNPLVASDASTTSHVLRGGGLRTDLRLTRCEVRAWIPAGETHDTAGLRLVREADSAGGEGRVTHDKPGN